MKKTIILFISLLLLSSCSSEQKTKVAYKNDQVDFLSISIPETWNKEIDEIENENDPRIAQVVYTVSDDSASKSEEGVARDSITFITYKGIIKTEDDEPISLKRARELIKRYAFLFGENTETIEESYIEVGTNPGYHLVCNVKGGGDVKWDIYSIFDGNKNAIITAYANDEKNTDDFTNDYIHVIDSLTLENSSFFTSTNNTASGNHSNSNYHDSNGYDMPHEGESFSDYLKRVDPGLYNEIVDRYDSATEQIPKQGESFSEYMKRVDPDTYNAVKERYDSLGD